MNAKKLQSLCSASSPEFPCLTRSLNPSCNF
uniref:Uncharacterized protein n=1 Tax=Anguilla anguilla TaxID=7936 RepID=A0A0E9R409_ANGAN